MANNASSAYSAYDFSYKMRQQRNKRILTFFLFVVGLFCLLNLILYFLIFPFQLGESVMNPTFQDDSYIFISPLNLSKYTGKQPFNLERGDVVLLKPMQQRQKTTFQKISSLVVEFFTFRKVSLFEGNNSITGKPMLRRVIGMPGDTLYIKDYSVYVRPQNQKHFLTEFELSAFPYEINTGFDISVDSSVGVVGNYEQITLKDDEFFVLADDRIMSVDSRLFGSINSSNIKGKAIFQFWPLPFLSE